ncbi:MAG: LD-carboxypeptidase [Bacteroidia bacterium]
MTEKISFLKNGDTVAIAATARKINPEEIQNSFKIFSSWGLKVKTGKELFLSENQFAGSDAVRTKYFQKLLDDKKVKAIFCARGGYGTVRIIDKLNFKKFSHNPKWIVGFSDITVLHSHIQHHFKMETIHSAMPYNMQVSMADEESIESLRKILFGEKVNYSFESSPLNKNGNVKGKLVGGNLSVLYSLLGSDSDINTKGKILFLEDLDEYLYHIDRMMMNLKRNGRLKKLAGLVVGAMSEMKDNTIPFGKNAYEIIAEHVKENDYPVCYGFPAGHEKRNLALKLGAKVNLKVKKSNCELSFD